MFAQMFAQTFFLIRKCYRFLLLSAKTPKSIKNLPEVL